MQLRVLGGVEAWIGPGQDDGGRNEGGHGEGGRIEIGHARQRCVLSVLVVEANLVVTTEQLVDRVWADRPPRRARETVSNYISRLRNLLAACAGVTIVHRGGGYILMVDPEQVDLHLFRQLVRRAHAETDDRRALGLLEQAAGLWHGDAFADLDTPWIAAVREGLEMERFAADADRIDLALRLGRHAALLPELTARAATHPLDERLAGQLMLALYRSGRQAEALAEFKQVRTRLAEELGIDPGTALQELHQRILATDPVLIAPSAKAAAEPSAAVPVPRQLPAPPRLFTGRAAELARLSQAMDTAAATGALPISVIGGPGGIGKTWLAVTWAHLNAHRFPDGQLFVDLHGFSQDDAPMPPELALRGFLQALGVDSDQLPADVHAQAALFRSLAAERQMLVVLDNAVDSGQITPLLPGGACCTVLVTSRHRLSGLVTAHSAHHLNLDVFTCEESHALLTRRLGAERVAAESAAAGELVGLCGGFPLALGIVGASADAHAEIPLAEFAAELRGLGLEALADDDPSASLPTVLSWSYRALTDEQQEVFGLLGIAPGPDIGLPAAASLTGLPATRSRAVLRALEKASLLIQDADGRYRMHALIRQFAGAHHQLPDEVRQAALRRVVDFYLHTAYSAERLLNPHALPIRLDPPAPGTRVHPLADVPAALAWLTAEHANLLAAQAAAAGEQRYSVVWQLAWALVTFHARRERRHDELAVWRAALDAAAQLSDPAIETVSHRRLGAVSAELGRYEEAIAHLNQAVALAEQQGDGTDLAHTHYQLAWAWGRRGDDQRALEQAHRALELCRDVDLPVWEADALNAVGWHAARLGDHDTARAHCQAALFLHRRHHNPQGEANALHSLGYVNHLAGHDSQAIRCYHQALDLYRAHGVVSAEAGVVDGLGHAHAALGQRDQACAVWQEALGFYRAQGHDDRVEQVQRNLEDLDRQGGESDRGKARTGARPA